MERQTMGNFIAALRRAAGMTQREMAERLNVSDKAVSRWERDESAPDLSLLPLIADLFGITIDELVRGKRNTDDLHNEMSRGVESPRSDERVRRGIQTIAGRELAKFRNRSLVAAGIGTAGMVVALLCNYCFNAAKLGFFLSLLLYGAAAMLETIFVQNYFASIGSRMSSADPVGAMDGGALDGYLLPYRRRGVRSALAVYTLAMGLFGATLPLSFAPSYTGLVLNGELICGSLLLCGACAALILLLYRFAARPKLIAKGILPELPAPTERELARRRVLKQYALILAIVLAVTGLGCAIFNSIDIYTFADATVFEDFDSFRAYMELPVEEYEYEDAYGNSYSVIVEDASVIEKIPGEKADLLAEEEWDSDTITDDQGNVLCRFVWRNRSVTSYSHHGSGLPIHVYTYAAMQAARDVQKIVNTLFALLVVAEIAILGLLCYRKCNKI